MNTTHLRLIAKKLNLPENKVRATLGLLNEGATIPFISRYRKEVTGSLDEVEIADIQTEAKRLDDLDKRRASILGSIEEQGKLTDALRSRIENCWNMTELEDIYLPYKKKRETRGMKARKKGLQPLAGLLTLQRANNVKEAAEQYLNDEVLTVEDALQGARDIIAEEINEDERARNKVRHAFKNFASVKAKVARGKEKEGEKYKDYFDFEEGLKKIPSHRLLAIRRGEDEGFLRVGISPEEEETLYQLERIFVEGDSEAADQVYEALKDCYKRLLAPSIETEFRNLSKEIADAEATEVFATNLKQLLLAAPLGHKRVLGLDPGFRTGCKVVVLDENGKLLHNSAVYPHPPQKDEYGTRKELEYLVDKYQVQAIAVGNGTAGRETESLCRGIKFGRPVDVFSVNEAGASIYSASQVARDEFPDHDVTVRGAVSIGRRLMDPLAELVKIDAKNIGVGQYQHDVNQVKLRESLDRVVESCVNSVGINVNTASKSLLTYVSGLGPTLAENIVNYRSENGAFATRAAIKKVPRMGAKAFEQAAGFLRIREAKKPLDNTSVHPESYHIVEQMAKDTGVKVQDLIDKPELRKSINLKNYVTDTVGLPTLNDIMKELAKPGLDPRGEAKSFSFAEGISKITDLHEGMVIPGIVTNITNFGCFVDVGVKQDGLVHVSQIANRFVKNPADVVALTQQVMVRVTQIDIERGRVQLSMKDI